MNTILIAEDDPLTGRLYETLLTKAGFQVELFADGVAFMARLDECWPDALQVDMLLPGLNGLQIIKQVRATVFGKHLPIVAVTNIFVPAMIKQLQEAGAT